MRVESNKTDSQAINERQPRVSPKPEPSSNLVLENYVNSNADHTKKDFASILNKAENRNQTHPDEKKPADSTEKKSTGENEKESKTEARRSKNVNQEQRKQNSDDSGSDGEQDNSFGSIQINSTQNSNEILIPGCRQILHVADLEKIIAKIRAQNVPGGKQVLIDLHRSVFEGLQIKLTVGKDKSVIAEFIAATETIKNKIDARAEELAALLRNRGVKLARLETSLDSDQDQNQKREQNEVASTIDKASNSNEINQPDEYRANDSDTSYRV